MYNFQEMAKQGNDINLFGNGILGIIDNTLYVSNITIVFMIIRFKTFHYKSKSAPHTGDFRLDLGIN